MKDIPHQDSLAKNSKLYKVIFSDVEGPMSVTGYDGSRFFVTFLDACTKESEIFLIKYKSKAPAMFHRYIALKERSNEGRVICCFYSDSRGEYLGFDFQLDLAEEGITFTYSAPASQQHNSASERLNLTLCNKAYSMINSCKLPKKYWPETVLYANYLQNLSPADLLQTTPFEAATGRIPVTSTYVTSAQNHLVIRDCQIFTKELKDQKDQKDQKDLKDKKDKKDQKDLKD
jgi:hypothetical protein